MDTGWGTLLADISSIASGELLVEESENVDNEEEEENSLNSGIPSGKKTKEELNGAEGDDGGDDQELRRMYKIDQISPKQKVPKLAEEDEDEVEKDNRRGEQKAKVGESKRDKEDEGNGKEDDDEEEVEEYMGFSSKPNSEKQQEAQQRNRPRAQSMKAGSNNSTGFLNSLQFEDSKPSSGKASNKSPLPNVFVGSPHPLFRKNSFNASGIGAGATSIGFGNRKMSMNLSPQPLPVRVAPPPLADRCVGTTRRFMSNVTSANSNSKTITSTFNRMHRKRYAHYNISEAHTLEGKSRGGRFATNSANNSSHDVLQRAPTDTSASAVANNTNAPSRGDFTFRSELSGDFGHGYMATVVDLPSVTSLSSQVTLLRPTPLKSTAAAARRSPVQVQLTAPVFRKYASEKEANA